jgi:hypothetical protein
VIGPGAHPASRVLAGAKKIAPALGARMAASQLLDRSVFVRELLPQDLKVELDQLSVEADEASPTTYGARRRGCCEHRGSVHGDPDVG